MTVAVNQAVEEKLARLQTSTQQINHILQIGRDCASRLPKGLAQRDHGDILYGADGLPK
jgi:hypothetical protein